MATNPQSLTALRKQIAQLQDTEKALRDANSRLARHLEELNAAKQQTSALEMQVGGSHYKDMAIQPVEYILANNLSYIEGNIVKYASRWKDKGGIKDLEKIKHFADLLIEDTLSKQEALQRTDSNRISSAENCCAQSGLSPVTLANYDTKAGTRC